MKGAIIVASDPDFVNWSAATLDERGYEVSLRADTLQLSENGRLITLYGRANALKDLIPDLDAIGDRELLNGKNYAYLVDCRWEDLFCRVMKDLAQSASGSFVVVDNEYTVLDPAACDPTRIHL